MRAIFENVKEAIYCTIDKYGHINGFKSYAGKPCIVVILEGEVEDGDKDGDTKKTG